MKLSHCQHSSYALQYGLLTIVCHCSCRRTLNPGDVVSFQGSRLPCDAYLYDNWINCGLHTREQCGRSNKTPHDDVVGATNCGRCKRYWQVLGDGSLKRSLGSVWRVVWKSQSTVKEWGATANDAVCKIPIKECCRDRQVKPKKHWRNSSEAARVRELDAAHTSDRRAFP